MISLKMLPLAVGILIVIFLASLSFMTRHHRIKPEDQRILSPCPESPNCVSSQASNETQKIPAFELLNNDPKFSWDRFIQAVESAGGKILVNDGRYCHAVFTSTLFRFKDDVEAVLQADKIAVRSASRAGHSDLGANRKRVQRISSYYR